MPNCSSQGAKYIILTSFGASYLFDQDYTTISVKTSGLAPPPPKQLGPVRRGAAEHCGPGWVPTPADLCYVKHLHFAAQL